MSLESTGLLAAALLAIPVVNMTLYTTASLGGYGEALLIGNLLLLVSFSVARKPQSPGLSWRLVLWGFLAGAGLWANGLTLVYSLPSGIYLLLADWNQQETVNGIKRVNLPLLGFAIGALPWWGYAATRGPGTLFKELLGGAVSVETGTWASQVFSHLINFLLLGMTALLGLRPPWTVEWLALPLLPVALIVWASVILFWFRSLKAETPHRAAYAVLAGVVAVTAAGFLFTPFGVDPSGRYFLPMTVPLALAAARMMITSTRFRWQVGALAAVIVLFQLWGNLQCAFQNPPGLTTQFYEPSIIDHRADSQLIRFLEDEGETRGYSNYWVTYPLAFQSSEKLIFIPRLPYHLDLRYTARDDRYAPYFQQVSQSDHVAYITTRSPDLDQYLVDEFERSGVTYQEKQIGDYHVYFHLSKPVRPEQIGLGAGSE